MLETPVAMGTSGDMIRQMQLKQQELDAAMQKQQVCCYILDL